MNNQLRAPRAPTDQLRLESISILARLEKIIEFRPWIISKNQYLKDPPYKVLFDSFSLGAPLGVLLDLLGSPAPSDLNVDVEDFDFDLSLAERERFVQSFIQRVHLLEVTGRLSYGEIIRVDDLFNGTSSGFMKVLKTVNRILAALQDCYPGLFVITEDADYKKSAAVQELMDSEHIHLEFLRTVVDHAAFLSCESKNLELQLENIVVTNQRLRIYHDRVLLSLQQAQSAPGIDDWEVIFGFDEHSTRNNMATTYRSLCISYLSLYDYFDQIMGTLEPVLAAHAQVLLDILCYVPTRITEYCKQLQNILSLTLPTSLPARFHHSPHDSLCSIILKMTDISVGIDEMSRELRTLRAVKILKGRAFHWRAPDSSRRIDPSELGTLILDDQLVLEDTEVTLGPVVYQVFLFEAMLLCCMDEPENRLHNEDNVGPAKYPVKAWELGPALKRGIPLNLMYAIPTKELRELRVLDFDLFELSWCRDSEQGQRSPYTQSTVTLLFRCPSGVDQQGQWFSILASFVPFVNTMQPDVVGIHFGYDLEDEQHENVKSLVLSGDITQEPLQDDFSSDFAKFRSSPVSNGGRRHSNPRPWSLIGRKGPHSESSSLHQQLLEEREHEIDPIDVLSPNMLPTLFTSLSAGSKGSFPPLSPISLESRAEGDTGVSTHMMMPLTPPPEGDLVNEIIVSERVMDFTGQIKLEGPCAVAGGGYSDVWIGLLNSSKTGHGQEVKVAIKVIRSHHYGDSESDSILKKRLARELDVWKQLKHPNILPLYGTVSGFGPYNSLVCPWMENGSVSRYMEKWGDILSMSDRLQLLCEVADGLRYLHHHGIVHGDLTGSNILINDRGKACLCDFGLSNIVTEFQEVFSNHSTISGAIRWADATLFTAQAAQADNDEDEHPTLTLTDRSDIYSFGSVTLEILSGRIPYHYIRNDAQVIFELARGKKPRRPAMTFVTDAQWAFISSCWHDDPVLRPDVEEVVDTVQVLLRASLDFRRHTGIVWDVGLLDGALEPHAVGTSRRRSEPLRNGTQQ